MNAAPDFSKLISAAVELADQVINRPSTACRLPAITDLVVSIEAARAVMVEGGNPIRGEVSMLLEACANIEAEREARDPFRAAEWGMVAGVLLPMARMNLAMALTLRMRRPASTEQDYFQSRGKRS